VGVFIVLNRIFAALQSSSEVRSPTSWARRGDHGTPIPRRAVGEVSYVSRGERA